ncbi:SusE domain-containing protein [Pontibacter sp. SGAir0037]|uniref:SusE domain-containing protein n=1 Tax=Pontibacter sp. SGAir0037 TaxID=2571030 RepID=UPI0010CD13C8|nr:SusE domain-containing protein [Pontibacter sp. SGAir0037]QCR22789.1 hypothetical protein C1N53_10850 [Pontibacter sp. SGAir0037]
MNRHISRCLAFAITLLVCVACEKDPELTVLQKVLFTSAPEVSATSLVLTEENAEGQALNVTWPEVKYPVQAPVTYSIQVTLPADTIGANAWKNAFEKEIGDDATTASFTVKELNDIAKNLGLQADAEGTIAIRVKAYLDREAYSQAVVVKVTPYQTFTSYPALWVAGDFQGWNIESAPTIVSVNDNGIYEGYIYIPAGGTNEFKVYAQPNWEPVSYGDGGDGNLIEANFAGANFQAPSEGYYLFSVNLNTMKYMLMKTSWGMIGGATPGGWDSDTEMTYNPNNQTWSVTANMTADGSFKFRANKAWLLDFGINGDGKLAYANHPWLDYVDQPQLTVPQNGNYTITLDLHVPGNYTYTIKKN